MLPVLEKAKTAIPDIKASDLAELKVLKAPPGSVLLVLQAVMTTIGKSDLSAAVMLKNPKEFALEMKKFDKENSGHLLPSLKPYIESEDFSENAVKKRSYAAAGLCKWVHAIYGYIQVFEVCKSLGHKSATQEPRTISPSKMFEKPRTSVKKSSIH
jgi:dynein heavy chain